MNKVLALWLGVLALALLLPAEVYCQESTTTNAPTTHTSTSTGMTSSGSSGTTSMHMTSMHMTTPPKSHGNVLHLPTSLFFVIISASLLRLW